MIWQWSRAGRGPVGMRARWKQVRRAGVVGLYPFTGAELGAVTLDAEAVPEAERGPFLQVVTPLLTAPGTAGAPGPAARGSVTSGFSRVTSAEGGRYRSRRPGRTSRLTVACVIALSRFFSRITTWY